MARQAEYLEAKANGENPDGDMFAVEIGGKGVEGGFQSWMILLAAIDVVVVGIICVWAYFVFIKEKPLQKGKAKRKLIYSTKK